jgi:hypothetical protein
VYNHAAADKTLPAAYTARAKKPVMGGGIVITCWP